MVRLLFFVALLGSIAELAVALGPRDELELLVPEWCFTYVLTYLEPISTGTIEPSLASTALDASATGTETLPAGVTTSPSGTLGTTSSQTSDAAVTTTAATIPEEVVVFQIVPTIDDNSDDDRKRHLGKRASGGFIGGDTDVNPGSCNAAKSFLLVEGELRNNGVPVYYLEGESFKELAGEVTPPSGAITTTFENTDGTLVFSSDSLPNGKASFYQNPDDGMVYISFTTAPSGYIEVYLMVIEVSRCQNGTVISSTTTGSSTMPISSSTSNSTTTDAAGSSAASTDAAETTKSTSKKHSTTHRSGHTSATNAPGESSDAPKSTSKRTTRSSSSSQDPELTSSKPPPSMRTTSTKPHSTHSSTYRSLSTRSSTKSSSTAPFPTASSNSTMTSSTTTSSSSVCTDIPTAFLATPTAIFDDSTTYDDDARSVTLPFAIGVYGSYAQTVFVNTNGLISLYSGTSSYSNVPLPALNVPPVSVFPYWDDLFIPQGSGLGIYYGIVEDGGDQHAVFEYILTSYRDTSQYIHFTATFYESKPGYVNVTYFETTDKGESATIGAQNLALGANATTWMQYSYNEANIVPDSSYVILDTRVGSGSSSVGDVPAQAARC